MQITKTMFGNKPMESAQAYNAKVLIEINARKVDINRSVFSKTDEEKDILHRRKLAHNKMMQNNTNMVERNEVLGQIAGSRTPRWGSLQVQLLK